MVIFCVYLYSLFTTAMPNYVAKDKATISKAVIQKGPGGSGGGNIFVSQILNAFTQLKKILKQELLKENSINTNSIEKTLVYLEKLQIQFRHLNEDNLKEFDKDKFVLIDLTEAVNKQIFSTPAKTLTYLVDRILDNSTMPQNEYVSYKSTIESAISSQFVIPQMLGQTQLILKSIASDPIELNRCRDQVQLQIDAASGKIYLEASSADSCFLSGSTLFQKFNTLTDQFHKPKIAMKCSQNSNYIECLSTNAEVLFDTMMCDFSSTDSSSNPKSVMKIFLNRKVEIDYVWCSNLNGNYEKHELKQIYEIVTEELMSAPLRSTQNLNEIEFNVNEARDILLKYLGSVHQFYRPVSSKATEFLKLYQNIIYDELLKSPIKIDRENSEAFVHFNEKTWIETDLRQYGEIRLRIKPFANRLITYSPRDYLHWLSHEICHHLLALYDKKLKSNLVEIKVENLAIYIEEFVMAQIQFPDLLDISIGKYFTIQAGCRDELSVDSVDSSVGQIKISMNTSDGHCRIFAPYFENKNVDNKYIFDRDQVTLQCEKNQSGKIDCYPQMIQLQHSLCPNFINRNKDKNFQKINSNFKFQRQSLFAHYYWCLFETENRTTFVDLEQVYSKIDQRLPLSDHEKNIQEKAEHKSAGGGLLHIFRSPTL